MIRLFHIQNRHNYDVSSWRSIRNKAFFAQTVILQTVIFAQKLENVESSNREQEKLTPHTWRDKTSQTGFLSSLFVLMMSVWYRLL